jgi:dipeptidyl aminopeptidase/acylaminoacyl peptidase
MIRRCRLVCVLVSCIAAWLAAGAGGRAAGQPRPAIALDALLSFPFPDNLIGAPTGARIAWTFDERGVRNIFVADAPDFTPRRVTSYDSDDGQELTNLSFSHDGGTIVYVRGGDHGSNWPAEGNLMPDPTSSPIQPRMQVWAVPAAGGRAPTLLGEGDAPVISPSGDRVAFERDRKIWIAPIDGAKPAEVAFFARGESRSPAWSPDGRTLAFVSDRGDHSFIALFTSTTEPLRYIAPSTSRDSNPVWSPDGKAIAFVRQPGRGGVPHSPLEQPPSPWALWIGDPASLQAHAAWKSGTAMMDSVPRTAGGVNLHWGAGDRLVFLSYQDGWPHLYSVPAAGGAATLLTRGEFMVEFAALSPDRRFIVYNANTGKDASDIDRRHLFRVPVDRPEVLELTSGSGIEWTPVVTADGRYVACLGSDARQPPLPAVLPLEGGGLQRLGADHVPADLPSARLVTPDPVVFHASDGLEVHGQLFKTPAGAPRRPALVYVHGGPPRQMLLGWHYMGYYANDYAVNQYLASRGFIVLSVNYRLGIGYGHAFQYPAHAGARGASEYLDVLAGAKYLQSRPDVDAARLGIWGGSYGGYLTALALGRNSDIFATGVDIHGVHNWDRQGRAAPDFSAALAGDGMTEADLKEAARVVYESSPISAVKTWRSPVLLIQGDDDRNVEFHQTVDLKQRLDAQGVHVDELVIPDDIHDFLLWRSWKAAATATTSYLERMLHPAGD